MNSPSPLYDHSNRLFISSVRVECLVFQANRLNCRQMRRKKDEKEEKGLSEDGENKLCLARPQISEGKEKKKTHLRFLSTLMNNLILRGENVPRVPTFKRFSDLPPNNIQIVKGWSLPEIFSKPM